MLGLSGYASRSKELLRLINELRSLGAQSDIDLPRIAVIGNQSAGKSSVVEAISGITVPRDAGTCTRCPMECRISSSPTWQCKISIRREYNQRKRLADIKEVPFGDVILDKTQVEPALRKAQLSVLNPNIPAHKILEASNDQLNEWISQSVAATAFSRNVVCVDIEGPELTDLSFIDLPGIIANADNDVVQLVEEMVTSHICGNCIILVALPMTDDIENQKALKLAKAMDPHGHRTIGVITKPDMLPAGATKSLGLWADVIEGRRHPLAHGYYCTRQPDDRDRSENITHTKARNAEREFFRKTLPWAKSTHPQRFGTDNLISTLSRLLVRVIDETLPDIRRDAMESLENCQNELVKIPSKIDEEPATHMLKLITAFASNFRSVVKGRSDASALFQDNRAAYRALKTGIRSTAPNFVPTVKTEVQQATIWASDEENEPAIELKSTRFDLTDMRKHINKSMTRELPNNVPFEAKVALIIQFQQSWQATAHLCFDRVHDNTVKVLSEYIENAFGRYSVLNGHMKVFLKELLAERSNACRDMIDSILEAEMTPFTQNTHYLEATTDKWLAKYKDVRAGKTDPLLEPVAKRPKMDAATPKPKASEKSAFGTGSASSPFVIDSPAIGDRQPFRAFGDPKAQSQGSESVKNGFSFGGGLGDFGGGAPPGAPPNPTLNSNSSFTFQPPKLPTAVSPPDPEKVQEAIALLAGLGYHVNEEDLGKLNPSDEYETELKVMAEIRGYFQVAYKRVIDMVPTMIDSIFLRKLAQSLQGFLIEKFGLGTVAASERCAKYLTEDSIIVARRDELLAKERRLTTVQQQLIMFGVSSTELS